MKKKPTTKVPAWVRVGAICECHGEGRGNLFAVTEISLAANGNTLVWLTGVDTGNPLGWEDVKVCYRSDAARRWERDLIGP